MTPWHRDNPSRVGHFAVRILDNLQVHKVSGIWKRIEAAGARLLYLPSYSPEFNLIEQIFAKLKAMLRTAAARSVPDI